MSKNVTITLVHRDGRETFQIFWVLGGLRSSDSKRLADGLLTSGRQTTQNTETPRFGSMSASPC